MADKRYSATVSLEILDTTEATPTPFFEANIAYKDAPYDVVLAVQGVLLEAQQKLAAMGYSHAEAKGLPVPPTASPKK